MPDHDYDIGILGGGSAGLTIAAGASQFGARTLLIEKEKELGGDCLHYGCVPSKTLIRTAYVYHLMKNAERYGLPKTDLKPVDYKEVAKRIQSVIRTIQKHDSEERFCKLGVKVEFGDAVFADEYSVRLNGKTYSAKNWVIATGSSPSVPPIEGINDTPFITNKEIFSLDSLPKSMIAIGAGPIAIEMAQSFSRLGTKVIVVQRSGQILSKEDKDMADQLMNVMISEGVEFHLNSSILGAKDLGSEKEIVIRNKEGRTISLKAEKILIALGRQANLQGLGLDGISMDFDKKGLKLDSRLRTDHKHIYAAGDVTGAYQFTHAAGYEGGIVLSNAILHLPRKTDYTYLPWCTYTDPELASIGMNEKSAGAAGIQYSVWTEQFRANDRSLAEGEEVGKVKMLLDKKDKPIGIQILGPHAGELLGEWVAVMNGGVKLSKLAAAVHSYPTLAEINKRVVGNFFSGKIFSDKVKKALKFFFHLKGRACG
ncbi:MAG TPA: mercuric reductase [Nitrospirae bacterium]|nr:dihydrolipoyl dehydrogenase [bacterium BMS3Abin10]GBE37951.1 dihydrolipoyl dehydrogenase [bacterium BMS3Bbin08]HDH50795.1 mercuric reductase [Nitrospirota bacterium]HDO26396.1 mercuric reductase [Nitrospirota bacterium]HDZ84536.1 mercuric reductase [Nitrospirota bacterium]